MGDEACGIVYQESIVYVCRAGRVYPKTKTKCSALDTSDTMIAPPHTKVSLYISNFLSYSYSCFFIYFFFI